MNETLSQSQEQWTPEEAELYRLLYSLGGKAVWHFRKLAANPLTPPGVVDAMETMFKAISSETERLLMVARERANA